MENIEQSDVQKVVVGIIAMGAVVVGGGIMLLGHPIMGGIISIVAVVVIIALIWSGRGR